MLDTEPSDLRISMSGAGGLLLDAAGATFSDAVQQRVWAVAEAMAGMAGIVDSVPGMNNLMIVFDPLAVPPAGVEAELRRQWRTARTGASGTREIRVPVTYGGAAGADLDALAAHAGLRRDDLIRRHAAPTYSVAAVGAMPGFVYLSGLDPLLACPRRASPRMVVPIGSVIIGGAQAGIMPCTAPSGWHILGHTDLVLFDPARADPATFRPGDRLVFEIAGVAA